MSHPIHSIPRPKHPHLDEERANLLDNPHDRAVPPSPLNPLAQAALVAIFLVGVAAAVVFLATEHWRRGATAFGGSLVFLAIIRWVVDSRIMGVLAVRSRRFDSFFNAIVGVGMLWIAVSVDPLGS